MIPRMYQPLHPAVSTTATVRGLPYHLLHWGAAPDSTAPLVLMVHGWMDVAASYQFVADAFSPAFVAAHRIVAPDWRGYGASGDGGADAFWFADYVGDLDTLGQQLSPDAPFDLVGHSLGGNVAMTYAGARPERLRRLVNIEGFGVPANKPEQAPKRLVRWLDELIALQKGELDLRPYDSADGVARRLQKTNPRLSTDKADWLARHWAAQGADGQWRILGAAAHKVINPIQTRLDETLAFYAAITAPTLVVESDTDSMQGWYKRSYTLEEFHQRLKHVANCRIEVIQDCGHMLHHDQPQALAALIEGHLQG